MRINTIGQVLFSLGFGLMGYAIVPGIFSRSFDVSVLAIGCIITFIGRDLRDA